MFQLQTVYTKMHGSWNEDDNTLMNSLGEYVCNLYEQEAYVFTPEKLKQLLEDYTNRIVENAKVQTLMKNGKTKRFRKVKSDFEFDPLNFEMKNIVDKESITCQLPEFLKEIGYE